MKKYILLLMSLLLPLATWAAYTATTINLEVGGKTFKAQAQMDQSAKRIILGNGRNACIPQYAEGNLTIPGKLTMDGNTYTIGEIGQFAFRNCTGLDRVTIGEGVTRIGDCAFVGCSAISQVTLPTSLTSVGCAAFCGNKSLSTMMCNSKTAPAWEDNDVFNYNGTASSMRTEAQKRVLYVPANSTSSYEQSKHNGTVGWKEAFMRIYERGNGDVVKITSMAEFLTFRDKVNDGTAQHHYGGANSFELTVDLEFTGSDWKAIGTPEHPFDGTFDGGGHIIKGLSNTTHNNGWREYKGLAEYSGLFGYATNAYIHNFYLQNPTLVGYDYLGSVLGYAAQNTRVSDVLVTSDAGDGQFTVNAYGSAGGIVGFMQSGTVERCYFSGRVWSFHGWAGGIVSNMHNGKIEDCAAGSCVANCRNDAEEGSNMRLGGIVGGVFNDGPEPATINRCMSWNDFVIKDGEVLTPSYGYAGWILGMADKSVNITHCAYFKNSDKASIGIVGSTANVTAQDNVEKTSRAGLMNNALMPILANENWHYFDEGYEDYPIPITLADLMVTNTVEEVDDNGIVYLPVRGTDGNTSAYKVKGYRGTSATLAIPKSYKDKPVTHIMSHALEGNTTVTTLTMGLNIKEIGDSAFMGSAIANLTLGHDVESIGRSAFEGCNSLTAVDLPDKVVTVHARAFSNCNSLTSFNIGKFFSTHVDNFIAHCPNLTSLTVSRGNGSDFFAVDNVLMHDVRFDKSYVIACAPGKSGDYVLPIDLLARNEVHIFDNAFVGCHRLTSITLPAGKTYSMDRAVFDGCTELRYVDLRGTGAWTVSRNDPDNTFYNLPDRTIVWADAAATCNNDEENVVAGDQANSLILTDGWDFTPKVEFRTGSVTMDRELTANFMLTETLEEDEWFTETEYTPVGYTTYLPYPLTLDAENVSVYEPALVTTEQQTDETGSTVNVTTVTFFEVESGEMEAYTPYYIVVEDGETSLSNNNAVTITLETTTEPWVESGYTFTGTLTTIPNSVLKTQQAYILQEDNIWHKVPADKDLEVVYVGPFRAYFRAMAGNDTPASKLMMRMSEATDIPTDVTVIRTVDANGDSRYFDLNGRVLPGKPQSGFYIHNGKKYIAK